MRDVTGYGRHVVCYEIREACPCAWASSHWVRFSEAFHCERREVQGQEQVQRYLVPVLVRTGREMRLVQVVELLILNIKLEALIDIDRSIQRLLEMMR